MHVTVQYDPHCTAYADLCVRAPLPPASNHTVLTVAAAGAEHHLRAAASRHSDSTAAEALELIGVDLDLPPVEGQTNDAAALRASMRARFAGAAAPAAVRCILMEHTHRTLTILAGQPLCCRFVAPHYKQCLLPLLSCPAPPPCSWLQLSNMCNAAQHQRVPGAL
jgi:hypothetical protein